VKQKCHQNINLFKIMVSINMFEHMKLHTLNYVYEVLDSKT